MSGRGAQVAVLGMRGELVPDRRSGTAAAGPQAIRIAAFALLAIYGVARWSSMLAGGTHGRLVGILGLALLLVALRPPIAERSRLAAGLFTALVLLAALPIAGLSLHWMLHLRIAVIARSIGDGLSALPQVLVPYAGTNQWVRLDIVLGGAVLLLDAALLLAFAPRGSLEDLRRAGAVLPLVALVAVPSTLAHPKYPYLDGLVLFLLLAAFVLADRVGSARAGSAAGLCLLFAVLAMLVAPAIDRHHAWINYEALANKLAPRTLETFNWSQTYGPLNWPRRGRTVLEVKASRPEYWKTEDLDVFSGNGWTQGIVPGQENTPIPDASAIAKWSQTIQVRVRDMRTSDVVGAGVSGRPSNLAEPVLAGFGTGTWTTGAELEAGDSYTVRVYAPEPTTAQLTAAGTNYAGVPGGYRTILVSTRAIPGTQALAQVVFAPFHSGPAIQSANLADISGTEVVDASPYAPAYRLAQRLAQQASTPYGFALAVKRFLSHGYTYNQNPPRRLYPLESFLFTDKRGYCQQFAGAMALLLRMGGVPARVAVGFTQGRQDPDTGNWLVTDLDAHAWVEAWFPHFGWVKFDPTPAADPALQGITSASSGGAGGSSAAAPKHSHTGRAAALGSHALGTKAGSSRSSAGLGEMIGGAAAALFVLALLFAATRPLDSAAALVEELERGLARSGRPLDAGVTLAELERRLRGSRQAGEYLRVLREARFAGAETLPTPSQRRALRRELAFGLGPLGRLRALWALPPRRRRAPRIEL